LPHLDLPVNIAKAMVGFARLIRPTYAEANVGHPVLFLLALLRDWLLRG
jgi:hypothetical protein